MSLILSVSCSCSWELWEYMICHIWGTNWVSTIEIIFIFTVEPAFCCPVVLCKSMPIYSCGGRRMHRLLFSYASLLELAFLPPWLSLLLYVTCRSHVLRLHHQIPSVIVDMNPRRRRPSWQRLANMQVTFVKWLSCPSLFIPFPKDSLKEEPWIVYPLVPRHTCKQHENYIHSHV